MGQYRNGKWEPTFGDDQFGVVDSPARMYNENRELRTKLEAAEQMLEAIAALPDDWRGSKIMNVSGIQMRIHSSEDKEQCANELQAMLEGK